jgi:hypothetical protein
MVFTIEYVGKRIDSLFIISKDRSDYLGTFTGMEKYGSFPPLIEEGNKSVYFLIGNQTASGTGLEAYEYTLFRAADQKLTEVGKLPIGGDNREWHNYFTLKYESRNNFEKTNDSLRLTSEVSFEFSISAFQFTNRGGCLSGDFQDKDLALFKDKLVFEYDLDNLDPNKDPGLQRHREAASTEIPCQVFLKNHFQKLVRLAENGTTIHKCWLNEMLKDEAILKMRNQEYRLRLQKILDRTFKPLKVTTPKVLQ